jgi:uridine kinase
MSKARPYMVGMAGGSASGKTSILNALTSEFSPEEVALLSLDHYYFPPEKQSKDPQGELNFDLPQSMDEQRFFEDLQKLMRNETVEKEEYTFNNKERAPQIIQIKPAPIVLTEGLFIFHFSEVKKLFDHKIYVHADPDVRLERRIKRDQKERGYPESDVRYRWLNHVRPADEQFLEPYRKDCDRVIINNVSFDQEVEELILFFKSILNQ